MDFWEAIEQGVPCCVPVNCIVKRNGELVMGAGLAKAVAEMFPMLPMIFGMLFFGGGAGAYDVLCSRKDSSVRPLISFPTKRHFKDPSDISLIEGSATKLVASVDRSGHERVYLPRVGCGLGGLDWGREVAPLLETILDERFLIPH